MAIFENVKQSMIMKRFILILAAALMSIAALAQNPKNNSGESILGKFESVQGSDAYKVQVTRNSNGTFKAQIYWVANDKDPKTGAKRLDEKNPDKSLRTIPCDKVVLFDGLSYDSAKKCWNGTKIYDPQRGIRANVTCTFLSDGRLSLKGSVLGISETAYWTPAD